MEYKVITGILIGALISGISYLLKTKQENKKYFNEVLFNLLEIWKLINISYVFTSNIFPKAIIERIKIRFPKEEMTENDEKFFQKYIPQAMKMVDNESGFTETNSYERYLSSIHKLSTVQPYLAHDLSTNHMMIKYLKGMDNYIKNYSENSETEEIDDFSEGLLLSTKLFMETDALAELESDLKSLSFRCGVVVWYQVSTKIKRSKKRRESIPQEALDQFIDLVIEPLIKKHYQDENKQYPY